MAQLVVTIFLKRFVAPPRCWRYREINTKLPLDDLGHAEEGRIGIGRLFQEFGSGAARNGYIVTQSSVGGLVIGKNLRHRLDVFGVEFIELADVFQDFVHLRAVSLQLALTQVEIRQLCHAYHILPRDFHRTSLSRALDDEISCNSDFPSTLSLLNISTLT